VIDEAAVHFFVDIIVVGVVRYAGMSFAGSASHYEEQDLVYLELEQPV
jgi:hypothetical protein